ncbi:hypothetical protein B9Z55_026099 [Caenorhabditis nigoni]|nr:hypothetical protein B9Z55_026099 [Caenorhabditis nigoni]
MFWNIVNRFTGVTPNTTLNEFIRPESPPYLAPASPTLYEPLFPSNSSSPPTNFEALSPMACSMDEMQSLFDNGRVSYQTSDVVLHSSYLSNASYTASDGYNDEIPRGRRRSYSRAILYEKPLSIFLCNSTGTSEKKQEPSKNQEPKNKKRKIGRPPGTYEKSSCLMRKSKNNEQLLCRWDSCGKMFNEPLVFFEHVRLHILSEDQGLKKCFWEGCTREMPFDAVYKLACHVRGHTNEQPFRCKV